MKLRIFAILLIFLAGCSEKKSEVIQKSPDSNVEVIIKGVKPNFFDPFHVDINVKGYGLSETVSTEIYSSELNASNVKFEWISENECFFTFEQQDNTVRKMHLLIDENNILLKE